MVETNFEMHVWNLFRLSDGTTVFGGTTTGEARLIRRCTCELRRQEETRQVITVEGEHIPKKLDPTNQLRALATLDDVALTEDEARSGEWKLVPVS